MRRSQLVLLSIFAVAAFGCLGTVVLGAPGQVFPPKFLDGNEIDLYEKPYMYAVDEPSYVFHGWFQPQWSSLTSDERLYFTYLTVSLTIDGEPVQLKKWQHHYSEFEYQGTVYYDVKVKGFYVEFPAYHFEKGKYVFELRPTNLPTRTVAIKFH
jgi:hypothetical protein